MKFVGERERTFAEFRRVFIDSRVNLAAFWRQYRLCKTLWCRTITIKDRGGGCRLHIGSASFSQTYGKRPAGDFRLGSVHRTRHIRHPALASWRGFRKLASSRQAPRFAESVSITQYLRPSRKLAMGSSIWQVDFLFSLLAIVGIIELKIFWIRRFNEHSVIPFCLDCFEQCLTINENLFERA